MLKLTVVNILGQEQTLEAEEGKSLMAIMRDGGIDDLQALCGGSCSCATCHVYVEPSYMGKLPAISDQENDMLDCTASRHENSRLSCQLMMTPELDGIRVTVAEE